ncbi:type VI secretion system tube protein Hcp [Methylocaldum sp.]|uniref:Hcp family type VI secretion system effector n=1 Tax=Methylocaldum sp. TaxID=1969727 RepID=UPI002D4127EE|nr:type VI secretion system tube protein Hcp [Methylocaldum sp.]HYE34296.1 type VI secretion system tube protein Hcp [Methylocaldum sp.]
MILMKFGTEIKGDSTVASHTDWITVDSLQFGVGRAISTSGVGKDRDTSNPSFSEVTISKSMDVASTELWRQAVCGKSLGDCTIHFIQTGGTDAKGQVYLEIILADAIISSYSASSGGDRPSESISISFNEFKITYSSFDEGGTAKKGETKGWNLMKNEIV